MFEKVSYPRKEQKYPPPWMRGWGKLPSEKLPPDEVVVPSEALVIGLPDHQVLTTDFSHHHVSASVRSLLSKLSQSSYFCQVSDRVTKMT